MARPKTPTELLRIRGGLHRAAKNRSVNEPIPIAGVGSAGDQHSDEFKATWDELVEQIPPGVLFCSDRAWLEIAVNLLLEYRMAPAEMVAAKIRLLQNALVKLGCSPSDRANIVAVSEQAEDPHEHYFD